MSLRRTWTWELAAPRDRLWTYLADSDWVNEHAGLPRITARYEPQPGGGSKRYGRFRRSGITFEWEELPTIWRVPEFFETERRYTRGPLRRFTSRTALQPLGTERTQVDFEVEMEAASPAIAPLLPLLAAQGKRGANRAFALAERLASQSVFPSLPATLDERFARLRGRDVSEETLRALSAYVDSAEDRDLARMRPYELADRWKLPRREVLRAFLLATRAGLLNLRWAIICPGCRGRSPGIDRLEDVRSGNHCPACNIDFDAAFDRSVEVTFDARPLGHPVDDTLYCLASPRRSAHVRAQLTVSPHATQRFAIDLPPGTYDANAPGIGSIPFLTSLDEGRRDLHVCIGADRTIDAPHALASGALNVGVDNELERSVLVRIEEGRWPDTIVTAAQVTALQEFRDLFSSEVLAPGLEIGIETIAVLFTDLVGSTAMYSRTGDAPAFRVVNDHFDALRAIVAKYEGAIVKTIGDAIMAVFVDPAQCLRAALELDGCVAHIAPDGTPLRLRVGFHAGPCIAMRANDRVDYFGTTVNLAARLQSLAGAGEVTMATDDAQRPAIAALLQTNGLHVTNEALPIKGFAEPIPVIRVTRNLVA
jgi:class 3 adenylate cyclase